jgi:hypothetical protein
MRRQERKNKIAELDNVALEELKKLDEEASTGLAPNADGTTRKMSYDEASRGVDAKSDLIKERLLTGVDDKVVRQAVELSFDRMSTLTRAGVRSNLAKLRAKENQDVYLEQRLDLETRIGNEADPRKKEELKSRLLKHIAGASAAGIITDPRAQLQDSKRQIAIHEMEFQIRTDPETALARLKEKAVDPILNETDVRQLTAIARVGVNVKKAEAERERIETERELRVAREETENEFIDQLAKDPMGLNTHVIADSNLSPADKLKWIAITKKAQSGDVLGTEPALYQRLFENIWADPSDDNYIKDMGELNTYLGGGLGPQELQQLRREVLLRDNPETTRDGQMKAALLKSAKSQLTGSNPLTGMRDPKGDELYYRYQYEFNAEFAKQRAAGKTVDELLNPNSKDYLGNLIQKYMRSPTDFLRDIAIASDPNAAPQASTPSSPAQSEAAGDPRQPGSYNSPEELREAVRAGQLSREDAEKIWREKGWGQ